jgi:lipase ATG15
VSAWQLGACTYRLPYATCSFFLYLYAYSQCFNSQPSTHHITHVWHTADPIAMGTCTGSLSTCGVAGYAMESRCHFGNVIEYDTITNLSWSSRLTTHPIVTVIESILSKPWLDAEEQGLEVPAFKRQDDCVVRTRLLDHSVLIL